MTLDAQRGQQPRCQSELLSQPWRHLRRLYKL